jgi:hypothetical protein
LLRQPHDEDIFFFGTSEGIFSVYRIDSFNFVAKVFVHTVCVVLGGFSGTAMALNSGS